jgi:hypothetical protein
VHFIENDPFDVPDGIRSAVQHATQDLYNTEREINKGVKRMRNGKNEKNK